MVSCVNAVTFKVTAQPSLVVLESFLMVYQPHPHAWRALQGTSKSGLMGFCDCAPDDSKELQVLFLYKRVPYIAVVSDQVCTYVTSTPYHSPCHYCVLN